MTHLAHLRTQATAAARRLRSRLHQLRGEDRGSVSLEQAMVTAGLWALAGVVLAGIGVAVAAALGKI